MKKEFVIGLLLFLLPGISLNAQKISMPLFVNMITGEWNNFQQCWLENTSTDIHRVDAKEKHKHIHSVYRHMGGTSSWIVSHYEKGDTSILLGKRWMNAVEDKVNQSIICRVYKFDGEGKVDSGKIHEEIIWKFHDGKYFGTVRGESGTSFILSNDALHILNNGLFKHSFQEAYRQIKCRFFSGWIQYPMDHIKKDSVFFYSGLKLHDQGGAIQLTFPDGSLGEYTVELTQLVHSRKTYIMKLAVYAMDKKYLDWNSHSEAYSWAEVGAKRLGINIRKVVSGWTLIE